ncbi:DoxX family protein [Flammeovirgaceae bacterium KN852]|uniref:DoxX family protein n=2 Tax=Marinigracilibium pacificum TaxID=2729599 RepID=A0A848J304_9BACT|nr:DoxX family protein [Marinigracilibium pacificum]NMM49885.1 DoxX family protein [Marinigracilibium pacificum]
MTTLEKLEQWADDHRPSWLSFIRMLLGIFITYKGFQFMVNIDQLQNLTGNLDLSFAGVTLAHYIVFAHLIGGPLLACGLFTRFAAAIQIPILLGAVFLVNNPHRNELFGNSSELEVSIITLVFLLIFLFIGSGKYSVDYLRHKAQAKKLLQNKKHQTAVNH